MPDPQIYEGARGRAIPRQVSAALASTALIGCAQQAVDRGDFDVEGQAELELADGFSLESIDNGDSTWSYATPEDFDPEARVKGKIITWRYAGQAAFSYNPTFGGERTWIATEEQPVDPRAQLMAMRRVDRQGRVWEVDAVDEDAWARALGAKASSFRAAAIAFMDD